MYECRGGADFPGARVNPIPMYRVAISTMVSHCLIGAAVGNAEAALELSCDAVKARSTSFTGMRMRDFQAVQLRIGAAGAKIARARLLCRHGFIVAHEVAAAD